MLRKRYILTLLLAVTIGILCTSCNMIFEDLAECPSDFRLRFKYDYNIKFADAFNNEVKSVNVWAFTPEGELVWQTEASGEELRDKDFSIEVPLGDGTYRFYSWCGLKDNSGFSLDTYTPVSPGELEMTLNTVAGETPHESNRRLGGLYHGTLKNVVRKVFPDAPSVTDVTLPLMKDTKDIRVMLQHLDGSPIDNRDFSVIITYANDLLDSENNIRDDANEVVYRPWNIKYGQITSGEEDSRATETISSLMFELSTSRLMADEPAILSVKRNWDDREIIRINMTDYLLMVRGHYEDVTGREISEQEYLDRQDDYSMLFFLDPDSNWYKVYGIYINGWAVVPRQES